MPSAGLELTKLTYTRLEDNLIRHRGDQLLELRAPVGDSVSSYEYTIMGRLEGATNSTQSTHFCWLPA